MEENLRSGSISASRNELGFSGNYRNRRQGKCYPDRSGSFREESETWMLGSSTNLSRANAKIMGNMPPVSQWLKLDPMTMGNKKHETLGEVRKILGVSSGNPIEDSSYGPAHGKASPLVSAEQLKRFRENVSNASVKAGIRAERLDRSLHKLKEYDGALNTKKQQESEVLADEAADGLNFSKKGTLMQWNYPDLLPQGMEERTKNLSLNKRARSSVAENRASKTNNLLCHPLETVVKDMAIYGGEASEPTEEKFHRLSSGGQGWEKNMRLYGGKGWEKKVKRKRSMNNLSTRTVDCDKELKRPMHHKLSCEPSHLPYDSQSFRSGSSTSADGFNKSDNDFRSDGSNVHGNDPHKVYLSRDFMTRATKVQNKGDHRSSNGGDDHIISPGPLEKGKAWRAPRTDSLVLVNCFPDFPSTAAADDFERPPSLNKVTSLGGANKRKRAMPAGSSSSTMVQWSGQRPHKISRPRRANVVSPVSDLDEGNLSSGTNSLVTARSVANGSLQFSVKHELASSPARFSESGKSVSSENHGSRFNKRGIDSKDVDKREMTAVHRVKPSSLLLKNNILLNPEEVGNGVRRQGKSGRGSSSARAGISPTRELPSFKPLGSVRYGSDRTKSKLGRPPLKKLSDFKSMTHLGRTSKGGYPDFSGEPNDDSEELLVAANSACNASYLACSSPFWRKMEMVFASVSLEEISSLKQQLVVADVDHEGLSQIHNDGENSQSWTYISGEKKRRQHDHVKLDARGKSLALCDHGMEKVDASDKADSDRRNKDTPLYMTVLSALIMEDETEEFEENCVWKNTSFSYNKGVTSRYGPVLGLQVEKQYSGDRFSCNASTAFDGGRHVQNQLHNVDVPNSKSEFMHSAIKIFSEYTDNGDDRPLSNANASSCPSFDCQYKQMSLSDKLMAELESVGVYVEAMPDLADGEEETIIQEIAELQKELHQQIVTKKERLNKLLKAVEKAKETEERDLEQVAMDRLVEVAYRKMLATRGSIALRSGDLKVKQDASAFVKRILTRCQEFEETGKSFFAEPALRNILFAAPPRDNDPEATKGICTAAKHLQYETLKSQAESQMSGSFGRIDHYDFCNGKITLGSFDAFGTQNDLIDQDFSKTESITNRGRKKEVLLDNVDGASVRMESAVGNSLSGATKGKRSERERGKATTSVRNSTAKSGRRGLMGGSKDDCKTKLRPMKKIAHLSTSGSGETAQSDHSSANVSNEVVKGNNRKEQEAEMIHNDNIPQNPSEVKDPLDLIEQLGDPQDLSSWFNNFNEDDLADQDLMGGLEIPMDDLSELNMF